MARWVEWGRGHGAVGEIPFLQRALDEGWTVYSDLPIPIPGAGIDFVDAVIIGHGRIHILDRGNSLRVLEPGLFDWQVDRGRWIRNPLRRLRSKAFELRRLLRRHAKWTGPLDLRAHFFLPGLGAKVGDCGEDLSPWAEAAGIVTRETVGRLFSEDSGAPLFRGHRPGKGETEASSGCGPAPDGSGRQLKNGPSAQRESPLTPCHQSVDRLFCEALESGLWATRDARPFRAPVGDWQPVSILECGSRFSDYEAVHLQNGRRALLRRYAAGTGKRWEDRALWEMELFRELARLPWFPEASGAMELEGAWGQVFEWVEGITLATWVRRYKKGGLRQRLSIARAVATAVEELHGIGLTHGNLGPLSVLVEDAPSPSRVTLLPFSLDRSVKAGTASRLAWTRDSHRFLAPEILKFGGRPSALADRFGLGLLLFDLLAEGLGATGTRTDFVSSRPVFRKWPAEARRWLEPLVESLLDARPWKRIMAGLGSAPVHGTARTVLDDSSSGCLPLAPLPSATSRSWGTFLSLHSSAHRPSLVALLREGSSQAGSPPSHAEGPPDGQGGAATGPVPPLEAGAQIGAGLRILRLLAWGSRMAVYEVQKPAEESPLVLKVAHGLERARRALKREGVLLRRLRHPRLVHCHGAGPPVDGRPSLLLGKAPGRPLSQLIGQGELEEPVARRFSLDLMDILAYFHREGVVHRDLNPGHLMVEGGRLTVLDLSAEEAVPNPLYRDPAVCRGDRGSVRCLEEGGASPRSRGSARFWSSGSDRYSAALCLFELFTGRLPFPGAPRPGLHPELSPALFSVGDGGLLVGFFRRALDPDASKRFQSAQEMRQALVTALRHGKSERASRRLPVVGRLLPASPLEALNLDPCTVRALGRAGLYTVRELLASGAEVWCRVEGMGRAAIEELKRWNRTLSVSRGDLYVEELGLPEAPLFGPLGAHEASLSLLGYSDRLCQRLNELGFRTLGQLASMGRRELRGLPGIGPAVVGRLLKGMLGRMAAEEGGRLAPVGMGELWQAMAGGLSNREQGFLKSRYGLEGSKPKPLSVAARRAGFSPGLAELHEGECLAALDGETVASALEILEARLWDAPGALPLESLVKSVLEWWLEDPACSAPGMVRLLCHVGGLKLLEGRRFQGVWVSLDAHGGEQLTRLATAASRLAGLPAGAKLDLVERSLRDISMGFSGSAGRSGFCDAVALGELLATGGPQVFASLEESEAGSDSAYLAGPGEADRERCGWDAADWLLESLNVGMGPASALLETRAGEKKTPGPPMVPDFRGWFRQCGVDGGFLGWISQGGRPMRLMMTGMIDGERAGHSGHPMTPRGLKKCFGKIRPPVASEELRDWTFVLVNQVLSKQKPAWRQGCIRRAERLARDLGIPLGSSPVLPAVWRAWSREMGERLVSGLPVEDILRIMERHAQRCREPEEWELLLQLARLSRFLRSRENLSIQPEGSEKLEFGDWKQLYQRELAFGELAAVQLRQALERTPRHHSTARKLLERFKIAHDQWSRQFGKLLAEDYQALREREGLPGMLYRQVVPLLPQKRILCLVARGQPGWGWIRLLWEIGGRCDLWPRGLGAGLRPGELTLALAPLSREPDALFRSILRRLGFGRPGRVPISGKDPASGKRLIVDEREPENWRTFFPAGAMDLDEAVARFRHERCRLVVMELENALRTWENGVTGGFTRPCVSEKLIRLVQIAHLEGFRILFLTDGGTIPHWPGAVGEGRGSPPRAKVVPAAKALEEGWVAIPDALEHTAARWVFATGLGTHRGRPRAGYRGGCSPAEVLVPMAWLEPGGDLVPPEPAWWHGVGQEEFPAARGGQVQVEETLPPSQDLDLMANPLESPTLPAEELVQLALPMDLDSEPQRLRLPPELEPVQRKALENLATHRVLGAEELAELLGEPVWLVLGRMARLLMELTARGMAYFSVETGSTGQVCYRWLPQDL